MLSQRSRSRHYRLASMLLCMLMVLESTSVLAGPDPRAQARATLGAAHARPAQASAAPAGSAFAPPPVLPSADASPAGAGASDVPAPPAALISQLLSSPLPPQPAGSVASPRQASALLATGVALTPGWNLLSMPTRPADTSPAAVLASIAGTYDQVYAYNACDAADPWKLYDPATPTASDLTAIDETIGLWVHATASASLVFSGSVPPTTTIALCAGWNLIGVPLNQARPVRNALAPIAGTYTRVFGFEPADAADPWEVYDVAAPDWANDLQTLQPGRGYWVLATANTTLRLSNAGAPPIVKLIAPARTMPDLTAVTFITDVVGTVSSDLLRSWTLAYRAHGTSSAIPFAAGVTPVLTDTLGRFDPTLLRNGIYAIELSASDYAGRTVSTSVDVVVEGAAKVGNFTLSFIDLEVPLARLPIQVVRSYDSRDKRVGDFGVGWRLSLRDARLQENGITGLGWQGSILPGPTPTYCVTPARGHVVTITLPDDKVYKFRPRLARECFGLVPPSVVTIVYEPLPGTNAALATLDQNDQVVVAGNFPDSFNSPPTPIELWDQATFAPRDPNLYRLTLQDGRAFVIDQQAGLQTVTDLNGNTLTFSANGIAHSSGRSVTFSRDAAGRITRITDPQGNPIAYTYDAAGDLVGVADREGNTTSFTYDGNHYLLDIQDPRGVQAIRNEYDDSGRLLRHIDASGQVISYTHDLADRQELITDRLGHVRLLGYDLRGNVVRETDALGNVTLRTYDARDNRTSETDPLGHTTRYTYDARDNLLSVTDPLSQTTHYTYNSRGQVLMTADPQGHGITNTYDAGGNLTATEDGLGSVTRYTYDARGNLLAQTDPLNCVTRYEYDAYGNLTKEIDPLGHATTYTYDANGNRLTQTTTRTTGTVSETLITAYTYDKLGRLVDAKDPDGTLTKTVYDALGKQAAMIDKLGRTTSYVYDEMGRLTKTIYPDGTTEGSTYDAEGRRLTSTDRGGRSTGYDYDALGRLTKTTYPDGAFTTNAYDAAGRLIGATDALSHTTRYGYDPAGRRTVITNTLGLTTTLAYDANGNQVAFTDPRRNTVRYKYDALNRRIRTIFADSTDQQTAYDALGRRIAETDQAGLTTHFAYDPLGRLIGVTDALSQTTSYGYDEVGNRIRQTDANGHTTSFTYDKLGRQIRRTLPLGASETMTYDAMGNLLRHTDFNGATIVYTYDVNNRLTQRSYPDGSSIAFSYTPSGQRASAREARGTTSYSYDLRDRLTSLAYPDGRRLEYGYDAAGNRTRLTTVVGTTTRTTTYSYDAANRLATVTDAAKRDYVHEYDPNGNRARLSYPNGTVTTYEYDALNRLTSLKTRRTTTETLQSYAYTLGPAGNRTGIAELDGTARAYTYDRLYRLTQESVTGGAAYANSFSYDAVGNRLSQAQTTGADTTSIAYSYDARDRLLTENAATSTWDENGNLTAKSGPGGASYAWNFDNQLKQVTLPDGMVVEYQYDADGNRVQTKTTLANGAITVINYLVDTSGALSQVVAETNASGNLTAYYVRGDDLLAVIRGSTTRFYHADGLGSIRLLTDESGNVTDRYTFSAFGELLAHSGSDPNAYLFAGEPLDVNSGFYYNRARWMDPRVGRFVGMDPWLGNAFDPLTLHRYLYANTDPVNKADPSGREYSLASLTTVSGILNTINVISQIHFAAALGYKVGTLALGVYEETLTVEEALDEAKDLGTEAAINLFLNFGVPAISASVVRKLGNLGLIRLFNAGKINGRLAEHYIGNAYVMLRNVGTKIGQYTPDFINAKTIREIKNVSELRWSGRIARQLTAYATEAATSGRQFYIHVRGATRVDPRVLANLEHIFGPNTRGVLWDIVADIPEALRVVP